jgi:hypothetical protein
VGLAAAEPLDLAGVDVDADDVVALLGEGDSQWKSHVAEAHDADPHAAQCTDPIPGKRLARRPRAARLKVGAR